MPTVTNAGIKIGSIYYDLYSNKTAVVCRVSNGDAEYAGNINIPAEVVYEGETYKVTDIGSHAFEDCSELTSVTIPTSIYEIGQYAFSNCTKLKKLTLRNGVKTISFFAFNNCPALTKLKIPNSVTYIGSNAFQGCTGLSELTISKNLTYFEYQTFAYCTGLKELTIPSYIKDLGGGTFEGCTGLMKVTIENGCQRIPSDTFKGCTGLTELMIPNSVIDMCGNVLEDCNLKSLIIEDGSEIFGFRCSSFAPKPIVVDSIYLGRDLNYTTEYAHYRYPPFSMSTAKIVTIGDCVTTISGEAFSYCKQLTNLTIGKHVTMIEDQAFYKCNSLISVVSKIEKPFAFGNYAFDDISDNCILYVPKGTKDAYIAAGWTEDVFKGGIIEMLLPINEGKSIDIAHEIDESTSLNGNVVGDIFYNISHGDGSFDAIEGCIMINKPTTDSDVDEKNIYYKDFKDNYTGIVFMVSAGNGAINVLAETTGSMVLKVKIGDNEPITMELEGKQKVAFPYNVTEDTYVYIYGGSNANDVKGMHQAGFNGTLKIFGIEIEGLADGIETVSNFTKDNLDNAFIINANGQQISTLQKGTNLLRVSDGSVKKILVK